MPKTNRRKRHRILALVAAGAMALVVVLIVAILIVVPSIGLLFALVQRNLVEESSRPARESGEPSQATP